MKKLIFPFARMAAAVSLAGCDTPQGQNAAGGAVIGGATGALIGGAVTAGPAARSSAASPARRPAR